MTRLIIFTFFLQFAQNTCTWASNPPEPEANLLIKDLGLTASKDFELKNQIPIRHILVHLPPTILGIVPDFKERLLQAANNKVKLHFFDTEKALMALNLISLLSVSY